jgi:hypothetical protein
MLAQLVGSVDFNSALVLVAAVICTCIVVTSLTLQFPKEQIPSILNTSGVAAFELTNIFAAIKRT